MLHVSRPHSAGNGYSLVELLVVMALVSGAAYFGSVVLQKLGQGTQGLQNKTDFVAAQSLGFNLLSNNPHSFCAQAGIIGLHIPSLNQVSAAVNASPNPQASPAPKPDVMVASASCVHFPFSSQSGSILFAANGPGLLAALGALPSPNPFAQANGINGCIRAGSASPSPVASPSGSPMPSPSPVALTVPFSMTMALAIGGTVSRDFDLNLSVDSQGVIQDCLQSVTSSSGSAGAATPSPSLSPAPSPVSSPAPGSPQTTRIRAIRALGMPVSIPSGLQDWPDYVICRGTGGAAGIEGVLPLAQVNSQTALYYTEEGVEIYFNVATGNIAGAARVNSACGGTDTSIQTICAHQRCL